MINEFDLKKVLTDLTMQKGVAGYENSIAEYSAKLLKNYSDNVEYINGNVICEYSKGKENAKHILIDAHMDQVGFVVTRVTEGGFIKFANIGGIDARLLPAQRVIIHGKIRVGGIVSTLPPHIQVQGKETAEIKDMVIDTGYSYNELVKIVSPGDFISFDMETKSLKNDFIVSSALDDRCSMAAILYALNLLAEKGIKSDDITPKVTIMFSSQEELGELGAKIGCERINPDIAIEFDVTFAQTVDDAPYECGEFEKGPMIGISPSLSREISDELIKVAKDNDILYQLEIMPGLTSTNADRFAVSGKGVKTTTVSIPLRYMHTPCEVISIKDVEYTGRLLAAYIEEFE